MNKEQLRSEMKNILSAISETKYHAASKKIREKLFETEEWKRAEIIGATISRPPEVDTFEVIHQAWKEGKRVAVPKCYPKDKTMEFYFLDSFDSLETVYFGLMEPNPIASILCEKSQIDVMLVPGLLFDKKGYRIGFGGGFYDRYLPNFKGAKVALAFSNQFKEAIPHDDYDIPVQKIITDVAAYECNG